MRHVSGHPSVRFSTTDVSSPRFAPRTARRTRKTSKQFTRMWWAPRPWLGRLGIYRCVCLNEGQLFVGVATREGFAWVEAEKALNPLEAELWVERRD
jgi:hypothetical protein